MVGHGGTGGAQLPGIHVAGSTSPGKQARLREMREDARVRDCEVAVTSDTSQRQQQRQVRFQSRWHHVRIFYAAVTERVAETKRKVWLRVLAAQLHHAIVGVMASLAQMESAVVAVVQCLVSGASAWKEVLVALHAVVHVFQRDSDSVIDYREFLCACLVLDRWQDGERRMLSLWMDEYSLPLLPAGDMAIRATDVGRMLMTPCASSADEQVMAPFIAQLLSEIPSAKGWLRVADIKHFAETAGAFTKLIKDFCWRRLTDDMRLSFYCDLYRQAMQSVEREELNCRLTAAVQLWKLREPRARLARWKAFVVRKRLLHSGDRLFVAISRRKMVKRFKQNRDRRQQVAKWLVVATGVCNQSRVRWTFHGWLLLWQSMLGIHRAAWRRSVRHYELKLSLRVWKAFAVFVESVRDERAKRQRLLDQFIARRHHKVVAHAWHEWLLVFRRQKEVRVATHLERQLHQDIDQQRREEAEGTAMALEDALSLTFELKERQLLEQARRRAFQEQTDRIYANRKLKQQEEERTQFKKARETRLVEELDEAWSRIGERVAAEVRTTTLASFLTPEGVRAIQKEAAEIFERDPMVLQKALIQNPQALALPGCRWQLRLDEVGGRFAKAYYLNTETLEKFICDELVMENCEDIAKEVLIQRLIDDARARLQTKASDVSMERKQHDAAIKIQMLFRCRRALLIVRTKIRSTFIKRIEPATGDVVYFNIPKQETRRRPPKLLGSDERTLAVESTTWVRRVDSDDNNYYLHQDTGDTSWAPPPHHFMCAKCKHNFATRRWNETGARFCIVCYAEGMKKKLFTPVATWTKLSVQPAKCAVCRNGAAEVVCHQCRGDATCQSCCQAVHRNPKFVMHTQMDYLVFS